MEEEEKSNDSQYLIHIPDYVAKLPLQQAIDECDDECDDCYKIKNLARERGLTELLISGRHLLRI